MREQTNDHVVSASPSVSIISIQLYDTYAYEKVRNWAATPERTWREWTIYYFYLKRFEPSSGSEKFLLHDLKYILLKLIKKKSIDTFLMLIAVSSSAICLCLATSRCSSEGESTNFSTIDGLLLAITICPGSASFQNEQSIVFAQKESS